MTQVEKVSTPFTKKVSKGCASGLSVAARWFLDRGYNVSIPLEPAPYDLVTESDSGLKKVQVKTCSQKTAGGRYEAGIAHKQYDPNGKTNASGRRSLVPYHPHEVDLFFILTATDEMYLVPIESVAGKLSIVLDFRYAHFRIDAPAEGFEPSAPGSGNRCSIP